MAQSDDFYEILGLSREASQDEIRRAFRKLAMEHHPDRVTDPAQKEASEATFKRIAAAYEVLSDPEKKAKYDQYGSVGAFAQGTGFEGFDFGGFGDIFDAFFGGRRAAGPIRGGDLRIQIELEFEEAVFGCEEEIRASRLETLHSLRRVGRRAWDPARAVHGLRGVRRDPAHAEQRLRALCQRRSV